MVWSGLGATYVAVQIFIKFPLPGKRECQPFGERMFALLAPGNWNLRKKK